MATNSLHNGTRSAVASVYDPAPSRSSAGIQDSNKKADSASGSFLGSTSQGGAGQLCHRDVGAEGSSLSPKTLQSQNEREFCLVSAKGEGRKSPAATLRVHFESPVSGRSKRSSSSEEIAPPEINETVL
ncbi:uncharacterized protein LOC134766733 [Penaeus indicus]|uniref:uncharacterized protein LOC134766733 n=1 Tax=Penaeus indicus TaxID=29960 RepID=UPI00300D7777